jgi:hypothetical protein
LHKNYTTYSIQKIVLLDEELQIEFPKGKTNTKEDYEKSILKN